MEKKWILISKFMCQLFSSKLGGNDCGIFAIAFALHSLLGEALETVEFAKPNDEGSYLQVFKEERV